MANKKVQSVIHAKGVDISVMTTVGNEDDYISLTDIAKYRDKDNPRYIIQNWMRGRNTIDFLGLWEELNNPNFNRVEFDAVKSEAGTNAFVMTPQKWITATGAVGIVSRSGRYGGGTYAHKDIAFEFASWLSSRVQAVHHQGLPAAQRGRKSPAGVGVECKADSGKHELPDSY